MVRQRFSEIIEPRGLRREQAAHYVGVSPSHFDRLVEEGVLPRANNLKGCKVWDRYKIDKTLDSVWEDHAPENDRNPFDDVSMREPH